MTSGPRLERDAPAAGPMIRGFARGGFRVDDTLCEGALAITPLWARPWDAPASVEQLTAAHVADLIGIDPVPEFLLLGTGPALARPSREFIAALEARGCGVEPMDSRAAARAWGVLRGEGRWIAGALLPLA